MTDRPIVRIYTDPDGTEAYNIDRVDVWMGGQWQETEYDVIEIQYCWCGHSEGSHIMKWSNGYECLGCIDDGCDETCDHSSSHTFAEAEQYAPWGEQQSQIDYLERDIGP